MKTRGAHCALWSGLDLGLCYFCFVTFRGSHIRQHGRDDSYRGRRLGPSALRSRIGGCGRAIHHLRLQHYLRRQQDGVPDLQRMTTQQAPGAQAVFQGDCGQGAHRRGAREIHPRERAGARDVRPDRAREGTDKSGEDDRDGDQGNARLARVRRAREQG